MFFGCLVSIAAHAAIKLSVIVLFFSGLDILKISTGYLIKSNNAEF